MKYKLKAAYASWMRFATKWGEFNLMLIFGILYLTIFALFSPLLKSRDPLRLRSAKNRLKTSFWIPSEKYEISKATLRTLG